MWSEIAFLISSPYVCSASNRKLSAYPSWTCCGSVRELEKARDQDVEAG